jgi:hypothetical protein
MAINRNRYGKAIQRAEKVLGKTIEQLRDDSNYTAENAKACFERKHSQLQIQLGRTLEHFIEHRPKQGFAQLIRLLSIAEEFSTHFNHSKIEFSDEGKAKWVPKKKIPTEVVIQEEETLEKVSEVIKVQKEIVTQITKEIPEGRKRAYDLDGKRESRKFATSHVNKPAKCALLLPGLHQLDVIQMYEEKKIDENTQLIYVQNNEWNKTDDHSNVIKKWLERGRQSNGSIDTEMSKEEAIQSGIFRFRNSSSTHKHGTNTQPIQFKNRPVVFDCNLTEIGVNDARWNGLTIDFVWLDLCGQVNQNLLFWIIQVLSRKITEEANFSITVKNEWRSNHKDEYERMWWFKELAKENESLWENLLDSEEAMERYDAQRNRGTKDGNYREFIDNVFVGAALAFGVAKWSKGSYRISRPSEGQSERFKDNVDIHRYKKKSLSHHMAIHNFSIIPNDGSESDVDYVELIVQMVNKVKLIENPTKLENGRWNKVMSWARDLLVENSSQ